MKQIPNLFTLLNLIFGCIAIVYILEPGLILLPLDNDGSILIPPRQLEYTPEKVVMASVFIGLAAVVDLLDGFVARAFNSTSELGKQLDSLADTVSFCVAPSMIVYQFLKLSYAQHGDGLDVSFIWLVPAFIIAATGAYRLGKFNLDNTQSYSFKGVPTPAVGLLIASFPLIYWYTDNKMVIEIFLNKWYWYIFILLAGYLMVSNLPIMSLKFKDFSLKNNIPKIILFSAAVILALFLKWLAVPAIFILYIAVSLAFKNKSA
jgi:CDP-diacylglycerol---serine O-phosphatidyltransferase